MSDLVTALNTGTPGGVPQAARSRTKPYEAASLPAVSVYPLREAAERVGGKTGPIIKRRLTIRIECRAVGEPADQVIDPMVAWVTKALAGNTLNNLAHDIEETGTEWEVELADKAYGLASIDFSILYQTKTTDQEAKE